MYPDPDKPTDPSCQGDAVLRALPFSMAAAKLGTFSEQTLAPSQPNCGVSNVRQFPQDQVKRKASFAEKYGAS